jgi:hypothetical protein
MRKQTPSATTKTTTPMPASHQAASPTAAAGDQDHERDRRQPRSDVLHPADSTPRRCVAFPFDDS